MNWGFCENIKISKINCVTVLSGFLSFVWYKAIVKTFSIWRPLDPSNKSEEFPQILQQWWLSLRNFRGISRESFPVSDSSEILEKFPIIGPQDERFLWDHSFETQFREIPGNFSGISPQEIPEKFSWLLLRKFLRNS